MPTKITIIQEAKARAVTVAMATARLGSSPTGRILIILLGGLCAAYLAYQSSWAPLRQGAVFPAGISPSNPELATPILQDINTARTKRQQSIRRNFARYNILFVPPP